MVLVLLVLRDVFLFESLDPIILLVNQLLSLHLELDLALECFDLVILLVLL